MSPALQKVAEVLTKQEVSYSISDDGTRIDVPLSDEVHIVWISLDEDGQEDCFRLQVCVKDEESIKPVDPASWLYFDDYYLSLEDLPGELALMQSLLDEL